jgi:two-component system response regulator RegX3
MRTERMRGHILIVEDEDAIAAFESTTLEREGFTVTQVRTGEEAIVQIAESTPDLVLLDLMLPGEIDGLSVCQAIRRRPTYIPVIMVTAKDEDVDKVVGLEIGADDYITKPFNARVLLARVRAVLRLARNQSYSDQQNLLQIGPFQIDLDGHEVRRHDQLLSLTPTEFDLLLVLVRNPGRVMGRETLLQRVWGYDYLGDSRTVDVHIQRLRSKLEPNPSSPCYLLTIYGIGYKFSLPEDG